MMHTICGQCAQAEQETAKIHQQLSALTRNVGVLTQKVGIFYEMMVSQIPPEWQETFQQNAKAKLQAAKDEHETMPLVPATDDATGPQTGNRPTSTPSNPTETPEQPRNTVIQQLQTNLAQWCNSQQLPPPPAIAAWGNPLHSKPASHLRVYFHNWGGLPTNTIIYCPKTLAALKWRNWTKIGRTGLPPITPTPCCGDVSTRDSDWQTVPNQTMAPHSWEACYSYWFGAPVGRWFNWATTKWADGYGNDSWAKDPAPSL